MLERTSYPAGVPCWVDSAQPDVDAAVAFYSGLFGWQFQETMPPEARASYRIAHLRGSRVAAVGSQEPGAQHRPFWNTYVSVANTDDTAAKVVPAGGTIVSPPMDVGTAGRMAVLRDPAGAVLSLWGTTMGAQLVNEPGTWNWSDLQTRDIAGAAAFYGQVFGWEATPVDFGAGEARMWRMPGYGDFLEQHNPGVRQGHIDAGAPPGFTDAIGWLQQQTDDGPAHWDVTFSVDDADRIADRAQQLGGTVVVPPFDVPYARIGVVADPQGAAFNISKYNPPG